MRVPTTHAGFVKLLIVAPYVIVSVPVVTPLPRAEVRVIVMPPVPGNANEVGVLSGRVENPAVLGFDQMSSALVPLVDTDNKAAKKGRVRRAFKPKAFNHHRALGKPQIMGSYRLIILPAVAPL